MADIIFPGEEPIDKLGTSALPSNVDLEFWKGDMQEYIIQMENQDGTAINIVGYVPTAVIRQSYTAPTIYSFVCTVQAPNKVRLYLPSTVSKSIPAGSYVWNFQLAANSTGDVRTYLAGDVTVYAEVDG